MSGCYGNSAEDRARENELHEYLDSQDTSKLDDKIQARQEEIYGDMAAFTEYMTDGYEGFHVIARQLNRALCLSGSTDITSVAALIDAVAEMKIALDAHIQDTVEVMW